MSLELRHLARYQYGIAARGNLREQYGGKRGKAETKAKCCQIHCNNHKSLTLYKILVKFYDDHQTKPETTTNSENRIVGSSNRNCFGNKRSYVKGRSWTEVENVEDQTPYCFEVLLPLLFSVQYLTRWMKNNVPQKGKMEILF